MSTIDYKSKKTDKRKATKLIREIVKGGGAAINFSSHAFDQMKKRDLRMNDVLNVLHSPQSSILMEGEIKNGSYRYQYGTNRIVVVISFWPNGKGLTVITAWRR